MLIFLKLGGSLITEKDQAYTPRTEKIHQLATEIAESRQADPDLHILLGHGSGSFGHHAAAKFQTRQGVKENAAWLGFAEVWYQAALLNHFLMEALHSAGLPALGISPLSSVTAHDGKVTRWDISPLENALNHGVIPVIQGDVVFDEVLGGTILSTEDLFAHLAPILQPGRILLAGMEPGVWEDFPHREQIIRHITPGSLAQAIPSLGPSSGKDVTGGMQDKVVRMLKLIELDEDLQVWIFSGDPPGNLRSACSGINPGTSLNVDKPSNRQ